MNDDDGKDKKIRLDRFTVDFSDLILIEKGTGPSAAEIRRKWEQEQREKHKENTPGDNDKDNQGNQDKPG